MKRILAIMLAMFMVLSMAGCSGGKNDVSSSDASGSNDGSSDVSSDSSSDVSSNDGSTYVPGTVENGVYTNTSLGYKFTLPEGWVAEDTASYNDAMAGMMEGVEMGDVTIAMDAVIAGDTGTLMVEVMEVPQATILDTMGGEKQVFDMVSTDLVGQFRDIGAEIEMGDITNVDIAGATYRGQQIKVSANGNEINMLFAVDFSGTVWPIICVLGFGEVSVLDSIVGGFEAA